MVLSYGCWVLQFCSFLPCHGLLTWSHCSLVMFRVAPSPPLSTATPFSQIVAANCSTVLSFNKSWIKGGHWCAWWGGDILPRRIRLCFWSSLVSSVYKTEKHGMPQRLPSRPTCTDLHFLFTFCFFSSFSFQFQKLLLQRQAIVMHSDTLSVSSGACNIKNTACRQIAKE